MRKHLISTLAFCGLLLIQSAIPAFAESNTDSDTTPFAASGGQAYSDAITIGEPTGSPQEYPVSINMQTIGGVPYITKVYEVPADYAIEQLVNEFEQDGYAFSRSDVLVKKLAGTTDTKEVSKTVTASAQSSEKDKLLATVEQVLDYEQDGYSGQLQLDASAISIEEAGRSSYSYTLQETREYDALDRNDAAYIDKTMQKNGATLELESVDWQVMGTTPVDGTLVPNMYKAVATYSGRATGSKASGYTATLVYRGEVVKTTPGQQQVSVIYRGGPIPDDTSESNTPSFLKLLGMCVLSFLFAVFGATLVIFLFNRRKKAAQALGYPEDDDTDITGQELLDDGYDAIDYEEVLGDEEI